MLPLSTTPVAPLVALGIIFWTLQGGIVIAPVRRATAYSGLHDVPAWGAVLASSAALYAAFLKDGETSGRQAVMRSGAAGGRG